MELELDWNALLSTAGGGGLALLLCKALITKSLRDLENLTRQAPLFNKVILDFEILAKRVTDILVHLSAIDVKHEEIDKINTIIQLHDRSISKLEAKLEHQEARVHKNHKN